MRRGGQGAWCSPFWHSCHGGKGRTSVKVSVTGYLPASHAVPLDTRGRRAGGRRREGETRVRRAHSEHATTALSASGRALLARDLAVPRQEVHLVVGQLRRGGHKAEWVVLRRSWPVRHATRREKRAPEARPPAHLAPGLALLRQPASCCNASRDTRGLVSVERLAGASPRLWRRR